ncbi:MAG: transcription antitermination factor NusB [Chlamydiota bacterium]|nr:transcription antitermination factor NusB [Chlamydiota bacterium]
MAVPQQKFREIVFQLIFSYDMAEPSVEAMETLLMKELSVTRKTMREAQNRVNDVHEFQKNIDQMILATSTSYDFSRIQKVEINILRLGVYEMIYDENIPPKVAISEAMRLARKFSTKESALFVNAVLDTIRKKESGEIGENQNEIVESFDQMLESEKLANEAALKEGKSDESNEAENPGTDPIM